MRQRVAYVLVGVVTAVLHVAAHAVHKHRPTRRGVDVACGEYVVGAHGTVCGQPRHAVGQCLETHK